MSKFKRWLIEKFLPAWCRDEMLDTNRDLVRAVDDLRRENERLKAYINGLEDAMRAQRRIVIRNEVKKN
nr:MAG TPA: FIP FIP domain [Caudoviricetes sp.]